MRIRLFIIVFLLAVSSACLKFFCRGTTEIVPVINQPIQTGISQQEYSVVFQDNHSSNRTIADPSEMNILSFKYILETIP